MDYRQEYDKWCNDPYFDDQTREELKAIAGDDKEIEDRFYRTLEFGTAGLRGVIGAGTNRMNIPCSRSTFAVSRCPLCPTPPRWRGGWPAPPGWRWWRFSGRSPGTGAW